MIDGAEMVYADLPIGYDVLLEWGAKQHDGAFIS